MDLDTVVASTSEVKRAVVIHIESIDAAVTALKEIRAAEMAKLELIEKLEDLR
ncbi:MAG: hypothetical protein WB392_08015 [Methanotrichaceae archaeon]